MISRKQQDRLILMAKRKIIEVAKQSDGRPLNWTCDRGGAYSAYYRLTESFGVKVYVNSENHYGYKEKFRRQVFAYRMGLAPYCFGMFKVKHNGNIYLCNITEHVTIHREFVKYSMSASTMKEDRRIRHMRRVFSSKMDFKFYDCHNANIGIRSPFKRKNELLCIDFDL